MNPNTTLASNWLRNVVDANRNGQHVGMYSVCSAHSRVLDASMRQAKDDGAMLSIESTSNQVNQFGGYTDLTPSRFKNFVFSLATQAGLPPERILLGGDHLGPYPWRKQSSVQAMEKACDLVRDCVTAGYLKIHLDASIACADDPSVLDDETVAQRAALLCSFAEKAHQVLPAGSPAPMYVIGTEVPVPGGEESETSAPKPTSVENMQRTLACFQQAFIARGLSNAWERVVGLVVQTGAEFGDMHVFDYDREKTKRLNQNLPQLPALVYEAHSTDYQQPDALKKMVEDHFAILKVGPWLTFAFREAIFALSAIERDWVGPVKTAKFSRVREALDMAMLRDPAHWSAYYAQEAESSQFFSRQYSYSDRCRYYWTVPEVRQETELLFANLSAREIPISLVSQYFPEQYDAIRSGKSTANAENLVEQHIRKVLRIYSRAAGSDRCESLTAEQQ